MRYLIAIMPFLVAGCSCNPYNFSHPILKDKELRGDPYGLPRTYTGASEMYVYAMMAYNAYGEDDSYVMPKNVKTIVKEADGGLGLQYSVFEINKQKDKKELVIAFRGTEILDLNDWWYGNLFGGQYDMADCIYEKYVKNQDYKNHKIIAIGHSLGGGLALHLSVSYPGVEAYAFNPSYRIFRKNDTEQPNKRYLIAEEFEILSPMRLVWREPTQLEKFSEFYCSYTSKHSMKKLSRCILHVAAITNMEAEQSLKDNIDINCETTTK
ncbi:MULTISPECIES: hypothetical protein [Methylomonas]|nr:MULTISPECIES: hypothetical protein [Methylomonas]TCV75245.1 hypothetical protein EDE11_1356 [Methylomonas methanica]